MPPYCAGVVDAVGRVGRKKRSFFPIHQPRYVGRLGRIAAKEAVITQEPEVAGLGHGFIGWFARAGVIEISVVESFLI